MLLYNVLATVLATDPPTNSYLPSVDFSADVEPVVQAFLGNGLILGTLISVAAIAVAALGARAVIGIFFTRH